MKFILAALAALLLTSVATADSYVSVYGGSNWDDVLKAPYVNDNTGYVVGAAVGTPVKSVPGLRIEGELSFRQNSVDLAFGPGLTISHETTSLMANAVYDLPVKVGPVQPYVLAGIGLSRTQATLEDIALVRIEQSGVAFQLGAGGEIDVADGIKLGLGYRFLKTEPLEVLGTELSDGSNHSVVATLRFAL